MPTKCKAYTSLKRCRTGVFQRGTHAVLVTKDTALFFVACCINYFDGGAEESLGTYVDTYTSLLSEMKECRTTLQNRCFSMWDPSRSCYQDTALFLVACCTNYFYGGERRRAEESLGTRLDTYTSLLSEWKNVTIVTSFCTAKLGTAADLIPKIFCVA